MKKEYAGVTRFFTVAPLLLLNQARACNRIKHYSLSTDQACVEWI